MHITIQQRHSILPDCILQPFVAPWCEGSFAVFGFVVDLSRRGRHNYETVFQKVRHCDVTYLPFFCNEHHRFHTARQPTTETMGRKGGKPPPKIKPGGGSIWADPARIRFAHARIRPYFSGCGRSVMDTLESIRNKEMQPSDLPPIQVSGLDWTLSCYYHYHTYPYYSIVPEIFLTTLHSTGSHWPRHRRRPLLLFTQQPSSMGAQAMPRGGLVGE